MVRTNGCKMFLHLNPDCVRVCVYMQKCFRVWMCLRVCACEYVFISACERCVLQDVCFWVCHYVHQRAMVSVFKRCVSASKRVPAYFRETESVCCVLRERENVHWMCVSMCLLCVIIILWCCFFNPSFTTVLKWITNGNIKGLNPSQYRCRVLHVCLRRLKVLSGIRRAAEETSVTLIRCCLVTTNTAQLSSRTEAKQMCNKWCSV